MFDSADGGGVASRRARRTQRFGASCLLCVCAYHVYTVSCIVYGYCHVVRLTLLCINILDLTDATPHAYHDRCVRPPLEPIVTRSPPFLLSARHCGKMPPKGGRRPGRGRGSGAMAAPRPATLAIDGGAPPNSRRQAPRVPPELLVAIAEPPSLEFQPALVAGIDPFIEASQATETDTAKVAAVFG